MGTVLDSLLIGHLLIWPVLIAVGLVLLGLVVRTPRGDARRRRFARLLLLTTSLAFTLGLANLGAWAFLAWDHRIPSPPDPSRLAKPSSNAFNVLTLGESTAQGEPYGGTVQSVGRGFEPWLTIMQLVGWRAQQLQPKRVRMDLISEGGIPLETVHQDLWKAKRRPDLIIVYAGHNEFQARFSWGRTVPSWAEEEAGLVSRAWVLAARFGPLGRLLQETSEHVRLSQAPEPEITRPLIDLPVCTRREYENILDQFRRELTQIVAFGKAAGAEVVLMIPVSNDGDFDPNRSVLSRPASPEQRLKIESSIREARSLEGNDPDRAIELYREVLALQPEFAEANYRLGRLLKDRGAIEDANRHFALARDHDGLPVRCPTPFREIYREVAEASGCLLIDCDRVLKAKSPQGVLDDHLFHDAHHPTLYGYTILAEAVLQQLQAKGLLGLDPASPPETIDVRTCAEAFEMTNERWAIVCRWSQLFYDKTAYLRFDPSERLGKVAAYGRAAERLIRDADLDPASVGIAGIGAPPAWAKSKPSTPGSDPSGADGIR